MQLSAVQIQSGQSLSRYGTVDSADTITYCQQSTLTENLNWRHGAGFGQFFIVVNSVYPNEAVPTDKLMEILKSASNETWDYFYFDHKSELN